MRGCRNSSPMLDVHTCSIIIHQWMGLKNSLSTSTGAGIIPRFILDPFEPQDTIRLQIRTFTNAPRG